MSLVSHPFGSVKFRISNICFEFFQVRLPEENNDKYSKFDTSKSMSYQGQSLLKMYSEETIPSFHECLPLLGFIMSKKQERLRSELLSEDKITNLLGFLT